MNTGREVRNSRTMTVAARSGLSARAVIYLLLGVLIVLVAVGERRRETDQRGALQELSTHTGGAALLLLTAIGLAGYALWRYAEAAFGAAGEGRKAGPRVAALFSALGYTSLSVTAFTVFAGRHRSQAAKSQAYSARVMTHDGGRLLVGVVGAVILVVGGVLVWQGVTKSFEKYLRFGETRPATRRVVIWLGVVGSMGRGIVAGLVGALVIEAAVAFDPKKASGVDSAIRTVAAQPFGRVMLVILALGLLIFGVYSLAEARWRIT